MTREQAIEIVKTQYPHDHVMKTALGLLIPELRESEDDEGIYREIYTIVHHSYQERAELLINPNRKKELLNRWEKAKAYLEKQKEQKPATTEDMPYITDEHFYEREPADSFKYKLAEYMTRCCTKKKGPYGYEYGISAESILKMAKEELIKRGELKEQKPSAPNDYDEKMRKKIIDHLESIKMGCVICTIDTSEEIAWLEKQKEQVMDESDKIAAAYQLGRSDERKQKEQKTIPIPPPYWESAIQEQKSVEPQDYSGLTDFERAIHRGFLCAGVENVPVTIIKETAKDCLSQMKRPICDAHCGECPCFIAGMNFQQEQKPALTPERIHPKFAVGDTICRHMYCDHTVREIYVRCNDPVYVCVNDEGTESHISFSEQDKWERKEQKPVEWSEEDELMRTVIIQTLERFGGRGTTGMQIDWLKSLRPGWKPSEEQMEALEFVIKDYREDGCTATANYLQEICDNIKKL